MQNNRDHWTVEAMSNYGGSFVKALAKAARFADPSNLELIKKTWPKYWKDYEKEGIKMEARHEKDVRRN